VDTLSIFDKNQAERGQASICVNPDSTLNWGSGMSETDPLFVNGADGDCHLTALSPCINYGNNAYALEVRS